jgi:hypothetical protein
MTRITNSDQILLLLRSHLQRTQRGERKSRTTSVRRQIQQGPLDRVQNLLRHEELTDEEVRRAVVSGLLANEFGVSISNNAKFQRIVDEVLGAIKRDQATSDILDTAIRVLRG